MEVQLRPLARDANVEEELRPLARDANVEEEAARDSGRIGAWCGSNTKKKL